MSVAFSAAAPANSGSAAVGATLVFPGSMSRQLLVAVIAVEGVAAGTGPYVVLDDGAVFGGISTGSGWERILTQAPSASGSGLEVWAAIWTSGPGTVKYWFGGTNRTYVARGLVYTGEYDPGGTNPLPVTNGTIRASTTAQVTGDNPACPSVYSFVGEMLIACAADQMQSPGFGTPTPAGWASRFDSERASTFGNVEVTGADRTTTIEGDTGSIPFSATASSSGTKGATATIAVRSTSSATAPGATSPLIALEYAAAVSG